MVVRVHGVHVAAVRFCVPRHYNLIKFMLSDIQHLLYQYLNQLINSHLIQRYFDYVSNLTSQEIIIITIAAAVLILIMIYRKLGVGAAIGLLLIYFFAYIIFYSNIFNNWQRDKMEEDRRMQIYNSELQKN